MFTENHFHACRPAAGKAAEKEATEEKGDTRNMLAEIRFLKALADETRLKIVLALMKGEKSATELVKAAGKSQPAVSLGLRTLENAGIIKARKDGKFIFYSIADIRAKKIISLMGLQHSIR